MPRGKPFESGSDARRNVGGRPREVAHVRELARQHTEDAVNTLVEIMTDPNEKGPARVAAAEALLNRGYGRPSQAVEVSTADGTALGLVVKFVDPPEPTK